MVLGGGSAVAEKLTFRKLVGGALTAPITLTSTGDLDQGYPFLSSDSTGRFHVVWRDATGGIVYRTSADGSAWTAQGIVAKGMNVVNPEVAAGPGSKGFVAWRDLGRDLFATPIPVFGTSSDAAVADTTGIDGLGSRAAGRAFS